MYTNASVFFITLVLFITVTADNTLQLVHVLFRHGDRTPDRNAISPNDPHINETYYPHGYGELNLKGKQKAYKLGKILRAKYDQFLGDIYTPDVLESWSSDTNRTKSSLQLVLAALFPPTKEQMWEIGLNWQPIPFYNLPQDQDTLFLGAFCSHFEKMLAQVIQSLKNQRSFQTHSEINEYVSKHSGLNINNYWDLFSLYIVLTTEKENGLVLPEWTKKLYPQPLQSLAIKSYSLYTATTEMKRMTSGRFLKKIIDDSQAKIHNQLPQRNRKMYLYSGHELNIAHLLHTMDVFEEHIPPYGAFVVFELHKIGNVTGFKIFYQDYSSDKPQSIKLPACDEFCPLEQFSTLLEEYFPTENICKS